MVKIPPTLAIGEAADVFEAARRPKKCMLRWSLQNESASCVPILSECNQLNKLRVTIMKCSVIGIDLSKNIFQICALYQGYQ